MKKIVGMVVLMAVVSLTGCTGTDTNKATAGDTYNVDVNNNGDGDVNVNVGDGTITINETEGCIYHDANVTRACTDEEKNSAYNKTANALYILE